MNPPPAFSSRNVIQGHFPTSAAGSRSGHIVQPHGAVRPPATTHGRPGVAAFPVNLQPKSGGWPLPAGVRAKMEAVLGANFSDVRIHVGPEAAAIGALAFTWGSNIHFAPDQYNPHTPQGQSLLGHELAHVVQQRAGRVANPFGSGLAVVQDQALEAEANRLGQKAAMSRMPDSPVCTAPPVPLMAHTAALSRKASPAHPALPAAWRPGGPPPVYRPEAPRLIQPKTAVFSLAAYTAPPVYCPNPLNFKSTQPYATLPGRAVPRPQAPSTLQFRLAATPLHRGVVQRSSEEDFDDFQPDSQESKFVEDEERDYEKLLDKKEKSAKQKRAGKPGNLQESMRSTLVRTNSGDEKDIVEKRKLNFSKSKYKTEPKKPKTSSYRTVCRRCGQKIYFDDKYKELGVIHDDGSRHEAPLGHKVDYSVYKAYLAKRLEDLEEQGVEEKQIKEIEKQITWHPDNLSYEHYDCNATAKKVTHKNITSTQEDKGQKFVDTKLQEFGFKFL